MRGRHRAARRPPQVWIEMRGRASPGLSLFSTVHTTRTPYTLFACPVSAHAAGDGATEGRQTHMARSEL